MFLSVSRVGNLWQGRSVTDSGIGQVRLAQLVRASAQLARGPRFNSQVRHIFHLPDT